MKFTRDFVNLSKDDVAIAGGKGASLGEMTQAGIPVPPGFVVLSDAFDKFIEDAELNPKIEVLLNKVDHNIIATVEEASQKIQSLILDAKIPEDVIDEIQKDFKRLGAKYVAIRSSATSEDSSAAAWAGQLDSYLNTTEDKFLENVRKCWASLFTVRAIFYRFEKKLNNQKISVAVVVQKMIEADSAGVAFSVHPVIQDENQIVIEAGFGLGDAIVSGQITPDNYVVEKKPIQITDINVSTQNKGLYRAERGGCEWKKLPEEKAEAQVLTENKILELVNIIILIENHYGFPCDIEWVLEQETFYITQSRPITTLNV